MVPKVDDMPFFFFMHIYGFIQFCYNSEGSAWGGGCDPDMRVTGVRTIGQLAPGSGSALSGTRGAFMQIAPSLLRFPFFGPLPFFAFLLFFLVFGSVGAGPAQGA